MPTQPSDKAAYSGPANAALDAARAWLWTHPPDGLNRDRRRERMAVIQAAANQLPSEVAMRELERWATTGEKPGAAELCGVYYYLDGAIDNAIEDIRRTKVSKGLVAWYFYNMGFVFKTPDACFGIDLCVPQGKRLAPLLDFLLVTHEHMDHFAGGLIPDMIAARKPVVTRFFPNSTVVEKPTELHFGNVRVKIDIGDHSPGQPDGSDNMLMFQIDCGPSANNAVIYHSGDGANYEKMTPDKPVDIFIPHVSCCNMKVADAIRHVNPRFTFVSHLLELTHAIGGARWSFDYAFNAIKDLPADRTFVLTWGERWALPGTELVVK